MRSKDKRQRPPSGIADRAHNSKILASKKSVKVDDGHAIATSFPIFTNLMSDLGAHITS